MPHFEPYDLVKWLHFLCLAIAGGAGMVAIMVSGLEDAQEEFRGLATVLWKKLVAWGFRLAVILGIVLLAMKLHRGDHPFDHYYLHIKLVLVLLLLALSEMSAKNLAKAKRGAPLLAFVLFLLATLVVFNKDAFGHRLRVHEINGELSAGPR